MRPLYGNGWEVEDGFSEEMTKERYDRLGKKKGLLKENGWVKRSGIFRTGRLREIVSGVRKEWKRLEKD